MSAKANLAPHKKFERSRVHFKLHQLLVVEQKLFQTVCKRFFAEVANKNIFGVLIWFFCVGGFDFFRRVC